MSNFKKTVGTGVLVGAAAGAAWVIGRRFLRSESNLIDWSHVRRLAIASCGHSAVGIPFSKKTLSAQYADMVRQAEQPIAEYTGKMLPQPLNSVHVFDRVDWVDANIDNFRLMFEPFEKMSANAHNGSPLSAKVMGGVNQLLFSGQMGFLLGYLARRVLGQYDLSLLGREPLTVGRLYFVEPNIRELQQRLSLDANEFRMWIVLHETTHAYEFEANPWLRGYMNSLITRYFETLTSDFSRMQSNSLGIRTLIERICTNFFNSKNVLELMMTPEQRHIFNRLQALMCLLEGYSNHMMQAVGQSILPSYEYLKDRFEERGKNKSTGDRLIGKLTGMDIKLEQYTLGERFVNDIVGKRGIDFMNRIWQSPLTLPTLDEVRAPNRWIERMEKMAVA
ncbi:MAG: zinc-dependent metalloprotease [Chloroflexi bacterium]|nr:zinc-dependent metalloprotease [Chloroflexota bacterium]